MEVWSPDTQPPPFPQVQESGRKIGFLSVLRALGGQLHRHKAVSKGTFLINLALDLLVVQRLFFNLEGGAVGWV